MALVVRGYGGQLGGEHLLGVRSELVLRGARG
jgi:hypothetical protein